MPEKLVILGTSGTACDILDVVEAINARSATWLVTGFLDDNGRTEHLGLPVFGSLARAGELGDCWFLNAIGSDRSYRRRAELIASTGIARERFATLVHPAAGVSSRAQLGRGVCVNYGASIAGNVTLGDHVLVGPRVVVGHDSVIGAYSILAPAAVVSGGVRIGRVCYIGAASSIRQMIHIGDHALVGLGAVVVHDVDTATTVVGNPARALTRGASATSRFSKVQQTA